MTKEVKSNIELRKASKEEEILILRKTNKALMLRITELENELDFLYEERLEAMLR